MDSNFIASPAAVAFSSTSALQPVAESDSVDMGAPIRSYFPETWLFDLVSVK